MPATLELARLTPAEKRAKQDVIARMDPRQLACRYRHKGFVPFLPGLGWQDDVEVEPLGYGVLRVTQACSVCTTRRVMITKRNGYYDPSCVAEYLYPSWWVHVKRDQGFNVTSRDCEAVLWEEQRQTLLGMARKAEQAAERERVASAGASA